MQLGWWQLFLSSLWSRKNLLMLKLLKLLNHHLHSSRSKNFKALCMNSRLIKTFTNFFFVVVDWSNSWPIDSKGPHLFPQLILYSSAFPVFSILGLNPLPSHPLFCRRFIFERHTSKHWWSRSFTLVKVSYDEAIYTLDSCF